MIPAKYAGFLLSFVISLGISFVMSFSNTLIHLGPIDNFIAIWMKAWATAFPVAFPTALVIVPLARKLVGRLTDAASGH
jgi:hypothetical protein